MRGLARTLLGVAGCGRIGFATTGDASKSTSPEDSTSSPTLSLVQHAGFQSGSASFPVATTAGNLLVALQFTSTMPTGSGWQVVAVANNFGAEVLDWPDNPGGITTVQPSGNSIIILEFSGVSPSVSLDSKSESTKLSSPASSFDVTGNVPATSGELELLYMDYQQPPSLTSESVSSGWSFADTDTNADYAWWSVATSVAPSATVLLAPQSTGGLFLVTLKVQ